MPDEICVASLVVMPLLILFMYATVALDGECRFSTKEIDHIVAKLMLASKLETKELAVSQ